MPKRRLFVMFIIALLVILASGAFAGMGSSNFRLNTSVISGGGATMSSTNFRANSTLGQSSPLISPDDPPYSANFDLYCGFWYTTDAIWLEACAGDFDGDGDVDGSDLAVFAATAYFLDFSTDVISTKDSRKTIFPSKGKGTSFL